MKTATDSQPPAGPSRSALRVPHFHGWFDSTRPVLEIVPPGTAARAMVSEGEVHLLRQQLGAIQEQLDGCRRLLAGMAGRRAMALSRSDATEMERVLTAVANEFGMEVRWILSRRRTARVCEPRFAVYWLLATVHQWPFNTIGKALKRDHSAVISGVKAFTNSLETEPILRERMERLSAQLKTQN